MTFRSVTRSRAIPFFFSAAPRYSSAVATDRRAHALAGEILERR